jgi:hypothetical protein
VLVAALARHDLLTEFRALVKGYGTLDELAALAEDRGPGVEAYKDFYDEKILSARVDGVPALLAEILQRMTAGEPHPAQLMQRWIHPLHSAFVDRLLHSSGILELREEYLEVLLSDPLRLLPDKTDRVEVYLPLALNGSVGQDFFVFGYGAVQCLNNPQWLSEELTLTMTVRNVSGRTLAMERGEKLGIASRKNWFPFGEALDCQLFDHAPEDDGGDASDDDDYVVSSQIDCEPLPVAGCRLPCAEVRAQPVRAGQSTAQSRGPSGTVGALQIQSSVTPEAKICSPAAVLEEESTSLAVSGDGAQNGDGTERLLPVMRSDTKCTVETTSVQPEAATILETRNRPIVAQPSTPVESVSCKQGGQTQSIAIQTEVVPSSEDIPNPVQSASLPSVFPVPGEGAAEIPLSEKSSICGESPGDSQEERIEERDPTDKGPHQTSPSEEVAGGISAESTPEVNIIQFYSAIE